MDELIIENADPVYPLIKEEEVIQNTEKSQFNDIGEDPLDLVTGQSVKDINFTEEIDRINNKKAHIPPKIESEKELIAEKSIEEIKPKINGELDVYIDQLLNMPLKYAYIVECKCLNMTKKTLIIESGKNPTVRQTLVLKLKLDDDQVNDLKLNLRVLENVRLTEIGTALIPLKNILSNKGEWHLNFPTTIDGRNVFNSSVNMNIRFRAEGEEYLKTEPPAKETVEQTLTVGQNVYLKPEVYGRLFVRVVKARRLRPMDGLYEKSDPYVEYWLSSNPEEKVYTGAIFQDLNPVWNDKKIVNLSLTQEEFFNLVLYFRVWDKDLIGEDFLGECVVDLRKLTNKFGNWINRYFKLKDHKVGPEVDCGDIYIQVTWLPGEQEFDGKIPELIETEDVLDHSGTIEGDLAFYIIKARNLRPMDGPGEKSDPYCEYYFSHDPEERYYTGAIFQDLSPIWNEKRTFTFKLLPEEFENWKVFLNVWDKDLVGEDFEGGLEIDLSEVFKKPGTWIKGYFPLTDKLASEGEDIGEIYLQYAWFEANKEYSSSEN